MKKFSNLPINVEENIKLVKSDNTSGSIELTLKAVETMNILVQNISLRDLNVTKKLIRETAQKLVAAQPSMASIFTFLNSLLFEIDKSHDVLEIKNIVKEYCIRFQHHLENSTLKISQLVQEIVKKDSTIIAHSYSSSVLNSLINAKKQGKNFRIICTESRPMNEGIIFARKLGEAGIKVDLVTDAAIFKYLDVANIVIVGGDAIVENGLVNKTGTLGIAIASKYYNVDFYSLCGTEKILPIGYNLKILKRNPVEITSRKLKNVTPINFYFDVTPLNLLTGIITEVGIKKPAEIKNLIEKQTVHSYS
ncbi:MAG: translation initiation factor eIF-2B [Candidatus Thermoplasmatota archaeon]|nr:translation initiation factor eIF-2B [Candidatus Thermoplasmatota archaeon]